MVALDRARVHVMMLTSTAANTRREIQEPSPFCGPGQHARDAKLAQDDKVEILAKRMPNDELIEPTITAK